MNGGIDRKFVAAGMNTKLQPCRQAIRLDRMGDYGHVAAKLGFELSEISDVVDTFVESPGKLRRNRLYRYAFVRQRSEDDQQFTWSLRIVSLIHRYFRDETAFVFGTSNVAIDASGLLSCE